MQGGSIYCPLKVAVRNSKPKQRIPTLLKSCILETRARKEDWTMVHHSLECENLLHIIRPSSGPEVRVEEGEDEKDEKTRREKEAMYGHSMCVYTFVKLFTVSSHGIL